MDERPQREEEHRTGVVVVSRMQDWLLGELSGELLGKLSDVGEQLRVDDGVVVDAAVVVVVVVVDAVAVVDVVVVVVVAVVGGVVDLKRLSTRRAKKEGDGRSEVVRALP